MYKSRQLATVSLNAICPNEYGCICERAIFKNFYDKNTLA